MNTKNLLKRVGAIAAAVATPGMAMAAIGHDSTSSAASATVRLTLAMTGTVKLKIYERVAVQLDHAERH